MPAANILETIGNTPHIRINRLFGPGHNVWIKSERSNPGGSIKDRIGLSMARGPCAVRFDACLPTFAESNYTLAWLAR